MSAMSAVWEDIGGCDNQYRCALDIYLMTLLSSSYGIIMDRVINSPDHGENVFDGLNATEKHYLKEQMKLIGKLASNDTSKIGMLPSASKDVSVKFSDQCIHILDDKDSLNGLKGSTKIKNIESLFKYKSCIYYVQGSSDVNHKGVIIRWNNKLFPSLNVINGKSSTYGIKGILRQYHYQ